MLLPLLHFNDVYRVSKQKLQSGETIDVSQFSERLDTLRDAWPKETGGLLLFSGDLFSPSVESSVTRGSHMVPVINLIAPDIALTGNHDFDFGYPHLLKLMADCKFPWILSNIIDTTTGKTPEGLEPFRIFERGGVKIGIIGLVEKNWITTVPAWPPHFEYQDMEQVGLDLSRMLRGDEYHCDIILALTHSRLPNDIALANALSAHANVLDIASKHGVDILFGGHDHTYYIGKGMDSWDNYEHVSGEPGTEADNGVRLVKSGTDFRDLSEMVLELEDTPPGSVRRKIIKSLRGRRHQTTPGLPSSKKMSDLLASVLTDVSSSLTAPVCYTLEEWDVRSEVVRTDESSFGNWIADVVRHAYDDSINDLGDHQGGADGVILCGGALRGDSRYGPGKITIGDVLEILPFSDAVLVIEMDGKSIWDVFESSLSMWPAQEGRFPVISGFRIEWDSRKPPGDRILGIWLTVPDPKAARRANPSMSPDEAVKGEVIPRTAGGKQYKVVTREYMYEGHDGCEALVGKHCLIDHESGVIMSSVVRKFLLGSQYIHKMKQLNEQAVLERNHLDGITNSTILRAHKKWQKDSSELTTNTNPPAHEEAPSAASERWLEATHRVLKASQEHCKAVIAEALRVSEREHMSDVDGVDGGKVRRMGDKKDKAAGMRHAEEDDLFTVRPVFDGRLTDVARPRKHAL